MHWVNLQQQHRLDWVESVCVVVGNPSDTRQGLLPRLLLSLCITSTSLSKV